MQSVCEYCNAKKEHLYLMTLPCGYVVCYDHLKDLATQPIKRYNYYQSHELDKNKCLICKNHTIDIHQCFEMAKNRSKLSEIKFYEHLNLVKEKIKSVEEFQRDTDSFLNNYLDPILNKIDLRREQLKQEALKVIDDEYFKFIQQIENIRSNFIHETQLVSLDNKQFDDISKCEHIKDLNKKADYFNQKIKRLKNFEGDIIESANNLIKQFKKINFEIKPEERNVCSYSGSNYSYNPELNFWNYGSFFGSINYQNTQI